jgi:lauroyl/myristoyl acyltransferase
MSGVEMAFQVVPAAETQPISDSSSVQLFPFLVRCIGEDSYSLMRIGCPTVTMIVTSRSGREVIRELRRGRTIAAVKDTIAARRGVSASSIDLHPILEALRKAKMIRAVDGAPVHAGEPSKLQMAKHCFRFLQLTADPFLTRWIIRLLPVGAAEALLFYIRQREKTRKAAETLRRTEENLRSALGPHLPATCIPRLTRETRGFQILHRIDSELFAHLPKPRLVKWLRDSVCWSGLEHLDRAIAKRRGVILCGLHFSSVYLLLPMLWLRGYSFTGAGAPPRSLSQGVLNLDKHFLHGGVEGCGTVKWFPKADFRGALEIFRALGRGETALVFADGDIHRSGREVAAHFGHTATAHRAATTPVKFLGQSIAGNTAVPWIHLESGAPILPVKVLRHQGAQFEVVVEPELELGDDKNVHTVTQAIYTTLERDIFLHPQQWAYWSRLDSLALDPDAADQQAS